MYKLLNLTTRESCTVAQPRFVKRNKNGVWVQCDDFDAQCIALDGKLFSIAGKVPVDDFPTIAISKINPTTQNAKDIDNIKAAINDITDAILDIYLKG